MKIFFCYKHTDSVLADLSIDKMLKYSSNSIAVLREVKHSENWKINAERQMQESDFVIFLIGNNTFRSKNLIWEYAKAKELNKQIIGIKLIDASEESVLFCQGFQVFDNPRQAWPYLKKVFDIDRELLLEQYKIMVSSTEKVTDQRMKVNNLFFTVTSTMLSLALIIGKTFNFTLVGIIGMILITIMSFLVTFFWEDLICSYGKLNKGKFKVIDVIEKQLRTNMFEKEWKILTEEIKYEPNSRTEVKIVKRFRAFIVLIFLIQLFYLIYKVVNIETIFGLIFLLYGFFNY